MDIDDFKHVNDTFGHPVGDRVLAQIARACARAARPSASAATSSRSSSRAATSTRRSGSRTSCSSGSPSSSSSTATGRPSRPASLRPSHGIERSELVRLADSALYWAKRHGKGRATIYRDASVDLGDLRRLGDEHDRHSRFLAAAGLARAVDARDAYTGEHSAEVGELAARIAGRHGPALRGAELLRLAGSLHDVGKLAIPEDILRKPGRSAKPSGSCSSAIPRSASGCSTRWASSPSRRGCLHHHERWDGSGYPNRLAGPQIPLGARILFVADAFDAMTTDRVYRGRLPDEAALRELERCAGTQFDPDVVQAFKDELAAEPEPAPLRVAV